ncbi:MAG: hypothetical protein AAGC68_12615 [Verrucomicrobiota bacterium]
MRILPTTLLAALLVSCQAKPYAPPPQKAVVDSVDVEYREFQGRPEAIATVKGQLTTVAAQLVDAKQSREGNRLYLEVMEQTPRGASLLTDLSSVPPFQQRIPLDLLGLAPGTYLVSANGIETTFELPPLRAEAVGQEQPANRTVSDREFVDEFIDIEDSSFVDSTPAEPTL